MSKEQISKVDELNQRRFDDSFVREGAKVYDLENRTLAFAKRVIGFVNILERTIANKEIGKQLVRSAGSVGANYIEANEALSKKDFLMRAKICRKEAKETCYWLKLIICKDDLEPERRSLLKESTEIMKIFGSIVGKTQPQASAVKS
jgi:four helix bundle protein